jgi:FAD/FMN-containing dehydrogenase
VLTADGRVVRASEHENADLFWALRGGGGNFGIVVEFEFALRPVGPEVLGGVMLWPRDRAPEVIRAYRELMADAPDALCGGLALMSAPPQPFVPAALQGAPAVGVIVLYAGDPERGNEHLDALRALAPAVDAVAPMPYCAVQAMMDEGHPAGSRDYYKSGFLDELSDEAIEALIATTAPSPLSAIVLQPLGGAFGRVDEMATALGHRDAAWGVQVLAQWADPAGDEANRGWAADVMDALGPCARPAGFPNFIADPGDAAVTVAYGPERYARLAEAKRSWDPDNVFRLNHNIRP